MPPILYTYTQTKLLRVWGTNEWLVDRKLVEAPGNFIAGRPKAALLFWFYGDFRCGVLFFYGYSRCL